MKWGRWKFLSVRPIPSKNGKNVLCIFYVFQDILSIFYLFFKPVKRLGKVEVRPDPPPPCWEFFPSLTVFFFEGFPYYYYYLGIQESYTSSWGILHVWKRGNLFSLAFSIKTLLFNKNFNYRFLNVWCHHAIIRTL